MRLRDNYPREVNDMQPTGVDECGCYNHDLRRVNNPMEERPIRMM